MAAARGDRAIVADDELREDYIIPSVFNRDVAPAVAAAVADEARSERAWRAPARTRSGYAPRPATRRRVRRRQHRERHAGHGHRGHRTDRHAAGRGAEGARRRGDRELARGAGARWDRSPAGAATRSPAATRSSTCAGENVAQRWTRRRQARASASSRERHAHLVAAIGEAEPRPRVLVCASAVGYYGPHGDEPLDEDTPAGDGLPGRGVRGLGARGAGGRGARPARRRSAPASCSTGTAARWRRCCRRSSSASAARSRAGASTCRGSTSTTSSASTSRRSTASLERRRQRQRPGAVTNAILARRSGARCTGRRRSVPALAIHALYGDMAEIVTDGQRGRPGAARSSSASRSRTRT